MYSVVSCVYMGIIRRIGKRSNTQQVNLPREICDALELEIGDFLFIEAVDKTKIQMRKIDIINNPSLRRLLPAGDPEYYDEPRD